MRSSRRADWVDERDAPLQDDEPSWAPFTCEAEARRYLDPPSARAEQQKDRERSHAVVERLLRHLADL